MLEKLRIGRFSGSYKRRNAAELAREKKLPTIGVTVLFLDDSLNTFVIEVSSRESIDGQTNELLFWNFFLFCL